MHALRLRGRHIAGWDEGLADGRDQRVRRGEAFQTQRERRVLVRLSVPCSPALQYARARNPEFPQLHINPTSTMIRDSDAAKLAIGRGFREQSWNHGSHGKAEEPDDRTDAAGGRTAPPRDGDATDSAVRSGQSFRVDGAPREICEI